MGQLWFGMLTDAPLNGSNSFFQRQTRPMRLLLEISFTIEAGNRAARENGFAAIRDILAEQKPEAVWFLTRNGLRTGMLIINVNDASQIAAIAEPWFLAFDASVQVTPVMLPEDLDRAAPAIQQAVKAYSS